MKRFVIDDATKTIINVILVDPKNLPKVGRGYSLSETGGNIGDVLIDGEWVTPQPDATEAITKWRSKAELPKADFCVGLIGLGILTTEDAVSASRGNWPQAMQGFLDYLTPEQAAQVQIEWATRVNIRRNNTFVLLLASYLNLTDATVDELFGWTG